MSDELKLKSPFTDYRGEPLFNGDLIVHPESIQCGRVCIVGLEWFVDYGDGNPSRLSLQVGDKGQAVKVVEAGNQRQNERDSGNGVPSMTPTKAREILGGDCNICRDGDDVWFEPAMGQYELDEIRAIACLIEEAAND